MTWLNNKTDKYIRNWIIANYECITVNAGVCRVNYKCHMNSVHDAINEEHDKIAMCFYFHNNCNIVHFVNVDKDGKFIDNTLGNWCGQYEYFFVRFIYKENFFNVGAIFDAFRTEIRRMLPWYLRWFSDVTC